MSDNLEKIGKYEVQDVLGKGAMGTVYKAFDPAIARTVAIKTVAKRSKQDAKEIEHVLSRFRQEAQATGRINHPNIIQIYDYGEDDNVAYIVMEFINGKTLAQHLSQETRYEPREAGNIILQILAGIGHAHAKGVVHRDLKPSNILINDDGTIRITDFGIARLESSELTQVGDVLGTPYYMSPEQFQDSNVGPTADIYSVGVIAYELLTGRKPFVGSTIAVMQQALNQQPALPSEVNHRLPKMLDDVLLKALAKKPAQRYQLAQEFAAAFQEALKEIAARENAMTAPLPADMTNAGALAEAARLLGISDSAQTTSSMGMSLSGATSADEVLNSMTGDSAITLDTGVRKARVLCVDDEDRILSALKSLLKSRYHVFTTDDGHKALEFLRKYPVHVIISDQRMAAMSGVDFLRQARELAPRSVRLLLTGYSDLASIVSSINDGEIYRFISKPWDNRQLQTIVAEAATIALELAEASAPDINLTEKMEGGVLVIEPGEEMVRVVRELVGDQSPVMHARNVDNALTTMHANEVGVVIADISGNRDEVATMLKLLKQENPKILVIIVTTAADSELVIELINEARIFRFLNKPVHVHLLKNHLMEALNRYQAYRQTPALAEENRVVASEATLSTMTGKKILQSLKALRWK